MGVRKCYDQLATKERSVREEMADAVLSREGDNVISESTCEALLW